MCDALQVPWLFDNNASDFNLLKLVNTPMATSVLYSGGGSAAKRKAEKSTPPNPKRTKKGPVKVKGKVLVKVEMVNPVRRNFQTLPKSPSQLLLHQHRERVRPCQSCLKLSRMVMMK